MPVIKWYKPEQRIILYMLDKGVPQDMIEALKLYCTAFYTGCKIEIMQAGDEYDTGKKLP